MTGQIFKNAYLSINGQDISDAVTQLEFSPSVDLQETTTMGSTTKTRKPGLQDWAVTASLNLDYGAGTVDALLWGVLQSGDSTAIVVRLDKDADVSAENPQFSGNACLGGYSPLNGKVGDVATTSITLSADGPIARATA